MIWLLLDAGRVCDPNRRECTDCGECRVEGCGGEDCTFDVEQRMKQGQREDSSEEK